MDDMSIARTYEPITVSVKVGSTVVVRTQYGVRWHDDPTRGDADHWYDDESVARRWVARYDKATVSEEDPGWCSLITRELIRVYGPVSVISPEKS